MVFRVVLICNGVYKKTLHQCKTKETAYINFHKIKENNRVYYPKKFINTKGIKPAKFELCITKVTEKGDKFRLLRDEYGRTYQEKPLQDWTILHSDEYLVEETFWLYGLNPSKDRPNIKEILKRLVDGAYKKDMVKNVIIARNKLVIYNEDIFEMVICKCTEDCVRLHHTLARLARRQKLKNLLFMGHAAPATVGKIYDMIHEETGWSYTKIWRSNTRP